MKIKYIALCLLLVLVGCQRDEEMEVTQLTINNEHIEPSYSSATISCDITSNVTIKQAKVYVSESTDFSSAKTQELSKKNGNTYSAKIDGLSDKTTYYVRYQISNRWVSLMAEEISEFQTIPATEPTVTTTQPKEITHNSAIMGGKIVDNGGLTVTNCGVVYSKSPNPTIENGTKVESKEKTESFTCTINDLDFTTSYYARAYAINEKGIAYGEEISLTTLSTSATMGDVSAIEIGGTTATIQAELLTDGGASIEKLGICYNMSGKPTINDSIVLSSENKIGIFQCAIDNLSGATAYYVRAFATNANGTVYSDQISFRTETAIATVVSAQATNVSYTSATVGGNVTNDGGAEVTERGVVYSTNQSPTTEDSKVASGSGLGEFTCNLTDLQDGTTYYARAYAINEKGVAYGEEVSFTTKGKTTPTVTTNTPSEITYTQAMLQGAVTDDGGTSVTEKGICYSTSPNPTIDSNKRTNGSGIGTITCVFSNLQDGTTYYARAYAVNALGVWYGNEVSFTTMAYEIPQITIANPTKYSASTATIDCEVTFDGGLQVTERGVCYSTTSNPTYSNNPIYSNSKVQNGSGLGAYSCELSNLSENTTYYVRAYAKNAEGIGYSEEVSFTTRTRTYKDGYEYVDLGLSVKWASYNIGATKPEEYGDYFAWGETTPKNTYDWSTYKHCRGSETTLTKYNTNSKYGTVDNKTELDAIDDAAVVNWGGAWRMPTKTEQSELFNYCTWTWTTQNGVNGYKVTSKSNGNSIFLPATGYYRDSSCYSTGSLGGYWSSSLYTGRPSDASYVNFGTRDISSWQRCYGHSVRPVCP